MIQRTGNSKIAVVGWGRGMGHKGHMYLASSVITQAQKMNADAYFFVSKTVGKDDPIFPEEKVKIYQTVFPQQAPIFQPQGNLNQALTDLAADGYQGVVLIVGADQKDAFKYLERPNKEGVPVYQSMGLQKLRVISRQETGDASAGLEGPRATPMREVLMHPEASEQQKFKVWRDAMPDALGDKEVMDLMKKAEARLMGSRVKKTKVAESRIMDRDARINAYYVSSKGDRHRVAENIPYYLLDKLVPLLTKKYAITMNDIEVRPADKNQYRRTSQPELAEDVQSNPNEVAELLYKVKPEIFSRFGDDFVMDAITQACEQHSGSAQEVAGRVVDILKQGLAEAASPAQQAAIAISKKKEQGVDEGSEEALAYATKAHAGQTRSGGDPYISHPVRVANHIKQYKQSHNLDALISAAYLHDTIEDTDTTQEVLHDLFGGLVASLVKELTSDPAQIKKMGKAAYLSHKMAAMSSYGLVIKLADRLDNVKDITTAKTPEWRHKYAQETNQILDYIGKTRALSGTHNKLIELIRAKLAEIDNPQQGVAEGSKHKCSCHPGDPDPDCPVHGLEPMDVGDALDVKKGVREAGITRRGILKGIGAAAATGAAGKASAIAGAFPTPSHQAAMYKAAADSNAAQARADAAAKAKADAKRLQQGTQDVERLNKVNYHGGNSPKPTNATWDGDSDFLDLDGTQYTMASRMPISGNEPRDMKLIATREGHQVYIWTRYRMKGDGGHYFYPAEKPSTIDEAGFDKEEFRRHMKDLEAREELRKRDPVAAKALDLRGQLPQQSKKRPEDDSIGINDPRHPGYAYTQAGHQLDEFAPGNGDDDKPTAEYEVYQCQPDDQFEWIGGPILQTDSMGKAHSLAYELWKKHPDKCFMIWQEQSQGSRGGYGPVGSVLGADEEDLSESNDYLDEK